MISIFKGSWECFIPSAVKQQPNEVGTVNASSQRYPETHLWVNKLGLSLTALRRGHARGNRGRGSGVCVSVRGCWKGLIVRFGLALGNLVEGIRKPDFVPDEVPSGSGGDSVIRCLEKSYLEGRPTRMRREP